MWLLIGGGKLPWKALNASNTDEQRGGGNQRRGPALQFLAALKRQSSSGQKKSGIKLDAKQFSEGETS